MQIAIDAMSRGYALLPNVEGIKGAFDRMSPDRTNMLVANQVVHENNVGKQTTVLSGGTRITNNQLVNSFFTKTLGSDDRSDIQIAYPLLSKSGNNKTNVA